ncbi:hypothetical protein V5O48_010406 [Marasmius crinis-equi]|uniref:Pheromone receptor n=1 Tax=Marasmius crinis-equi TaxID=585013 RepID=A0ABR3F8R8_9AGAR
MHPEFAPISFIAAAAVLLPLPAHWRARNIATLSIIGWLFVLNIIFGVDALVWADNVEIVIPVWCDITTKLQVGGNIALPAACLAICIHLEQVASTRVARYTTADRKRRQFFEAFMCILLPIVYMGLHFIVQGHRFDIIQGYGCRSTTFFSIPSIILVSVPPLLLSFLCLVYGGLALRHFIARRLTFTSHLSHSALTPSRFLRLITMSLLQMFWALAVSIFVLWFNIIATPIRPYTSWDKVHSDWLRIDQYAELFTPPQVLQAFYVIWWIIPTSTAIFVIFFAFGQESRDIYAGAVIWVWTKVLRQKKWDSKNKKFGLPLFKKNSSQGVHLPTLIKPGFTKSSETSETGLARLSSTAASTRTGHDDDYDFNARSYSQCYSSSARSDVDTETVVSSPTSPHLKYKKMDEDDVPPLPTSPAPAYEAEPSTPSTLSSFPATPSTIPSRFPTSTRTNPFMLPEIPTQPRIDISQRIADPAVLSRAIEPNTPSPSSSYPSSLSGWPRAI